MVWIDIIHMHPVLRKLSIFATILWISEVDTTFSVRPDIIGLIKPFSIILSGNRFIITIALIAPIPLEVLVSALSVNSLRRLLKIFQYFILLLIYEESH